MNTNKYFTAKEIYNRLSMTHKKKMRGVPLRNIVEWCATVEIEYIKDFAQFVEVIGHEVKVSNYRGKLPCNIFKLENVYTPENKRLFNYGYNGTYLFFEREEIKTGTVLIDYRGIPLSDEDNLPLLLTGHEEACTKYCIYQLYQEDFAEGKVSSFFIQSIQAEFNDAVDDSRSSHRHMTGDDRHRFLMALSNIVSNVNRV